MSTFLLDTHVWIWMLEDSRRLRGRQRASVEDADNRLLLSVASLWEMSIKTQSGRLTSPLRTAALCPQDWAWVTTRSQGLATARSASALAVPSVDPSST